MTSDHTYLRLHQLSGPALSFDLHEKAQTVREEARLAPSGRAAETLAKEGPLRLTILGFTAGSTMHEHHADGPLTIHVLDGLVSVKIAEETLDMAGGSILVLDAGVVHSLVAKSDAAVLLSIALRPTP